MSPQELATEIRETVWLAQARVKGIGAEQYYQGGEQKFETMDLDALLEYAEEEALDLVNYAVMARIRFARWRLALRRAAEDALERAESL